MRYRIFPLVVAVSVAVVVVGAMTFQETNLSQAHMPNLTQRVQVFLPQVGNSPVTAPYNWLQFDGNPQHSGNNSRESILSQANVASLTQHFQVLLPDVADGAPAYLPNVATASGIRDLLFVTSRSGHIVALDAHTGATVWTKQYGAGSCLINNTGGPCYSTSSPAVDPGLLYVYSYGLDGFVHKYQVGDGTEITSGGWPELATRKDFNEKGSSALAIATAANGTSYLYVANGGYPGDQGDYQGHLTTIDLSTGAQNVFNTMCSTQAVHFVEQPGTPDCYPAVQSAVWSRPGVIYDASKDRIYFATGNGTFDPTNHDWGDTVLELNPDGTSIGGTPLDSYTPTNFQDLQNDDLDLGSSAPALIPVPSSSTIRHLAVQVGKDSVLRLLDLDNLSGEGGPGLTGGEIVDVNVPLGGEVKAQSAVWVDGAGTTWLFVASDNGLSALKLTVTNGIPGMQSVWQNGNVGSSPLVANGVLYYAFHDTIAAYAPTTGQVLWQGTIGGTHWESPVVANGILYITDENGNLTAFSPG